MTLNPVRGLKFGAVSALCTSRWNVDLTLALLIGAVAGAAAALLVGLPALRLQGLYLAVTTLAFGLSVTSWLLNDRFFGWVPIGKRLKVSPLFGQVNIDTPTRFYAYSLAVLVVDMRTGHRAAREPRLRQHPTDPSFERLPRREGCPERHPDSDTSRAASLAHLQD